MRHDSEAIRHLEYFIDSDDYSGEDNPLARLLANAMHLCDRKGVDWRGQMLAARQYYMDESGTHGLPLGTHGPDSDPGANRVDKDSPLGAAAAARSLRDLELEAINELCDDRKEYGDEDEDELKRIRVGCGVLATVMHQCDPIAYAQGYAKAQAVVLKEIKRRALA